MEKFAGEIENLLQKKLATYQELTKVLEIETGFIIKMNVKSLWVASSRKKKLVTSISKQRESLLSLLNEQSGLDFEMDATDFNISPLISALPVSSKVKASLEKIKISITAKKAELKLLAVSNRQYIHEYLGVIDGVMSTITGATRNKSYGRKGISGTTPSFYGTRYGRGTSTFFISAQV